MTPKRIQRRRTKGWRMPDGAVYVGRPTDWGNPYQAGASYWTTPILMPFRFDAGSAIQWPERREKGHTVERCTDVETAIAWFRLEAEHRARMSGVDWLGPLRGRDLVCWCPLDRPCHADVLLELANG